MNASQATKRNATIMLNCSHSMSGSTREKLRLENLRTPTNIAAVLFIVPELKLQLNSQLHIHPDVIKDRTGKEVTALSSSVVTHDVLKLCNSLRPHCMLTSSTAPSTQLL